MNGRWTFLNKYTGFAPWTDGEAAGDSVFLYNWEEGHGASGTLVDGAWSYYKEYRNFYPDFTHLTATDDSLLFHEFNSRNAKAGTLENGVWTFANTYEDIGNGPYVIDYNVSVGAGDTLLLLGWSSLNGVIGRLVDGARRLDHNSPASTIGPTPRTPATASSSCMTMTSTEVSPPGAPWAAVNGSTTGRPDQRRPGPVATSLTRTVSISLQ